MNHLNLISNLASQANRISAYRGWSFSDWQKDFDKDMELKLKSPDSPNIFEKMAAALKTLMLAKELKPVEDLSEIERIAICWNAGVDIEFETAPMNQLKVQPIIKYTTRQKCAIKIRDGRYNVGVLQDS